MSLPRLEASLPGPGHGERAGEERGLRGNPPQDPSSAAMTRISASLESDLEREKLLKAAWCVGAARTHSHVLPTWTNVPCPG